MIDYSPLNQIASQRRERSRGPPVPRGSVQTELEREIERVLYDLRQRGTEVPPRKLLERQVLEQLVMEHLQLQLADLSGIRIEDNEVNEALRNIADRNGLSLAEFRQALEAEGADFELFREKVHRELTISSLRQRDVLMSCPSFVPRPRPVEAADRVDDAVAPAFDERRGRQAAVVKQVIQIALVGGHALGVAVGDVHLAEQRALEIQYRRLGAHVGAGAERRLGPDALERGPPPAAPHPAAVEWTLPDLFEGPVLRHLPRASVTIFPRSKALRSRHGRGTLSATKSSSSPSRRRPRRAATRAKGSAWKNVSL